MQVFQVEQSEKRHAPLVVEARLGLVARHLEAEACHAGHLTGSGEQAHLSNPNMTKYGRTKAVASKGLT